MLVLMSHISLGSRLEDSLYPSRFAPHSESSCACYTSLPHKTFTIDLVGLGHGVTRVTNRTLPHSGKVIFLTLIFVPEIVGESQNSILFCTVLCMTLLFGHATVPSFAADAEMISCVTTFDYDGCYAEGVEDPFSSKFGSVDMTPDVSSLLTPEGQARLPFH